MKLLKRYISSATSPNQEYFDTVETGIAYKVFKVVNGELYPPMVANRGNVSTPIGVWLDAEEGEFAGLSKTGKPQVKQADSKSTLAYRPGWHLGDMPHALQFRRSASWIYLDPEDVTEIDGECSTLKGFIRKASKNTDGKIFYIRNIDSYVQVVTDDAPYFPYNFIWAKCRYVMNVNYQEEAHQSGLTTASFKYTVLPDIETDDEGSEYHILYFKQGKNNFYVTFSDDGDIRIDGYPFTDLMNDYNNLDYVSKEIREYFLNDNIVNIRNIISSGSVKGKQDMIKFVHLEGDIKHLPTDGYYRYRTNPDPDTVPWVITGSMRVEKLLGDAETKAILQSYGVKPMERQGGDMTVEEILANN